MRTPVRGTTARDPEKKFGVDASHLIDRYGLFYVDAVLDNLHLDWEESSTGIPWLRYLQELGGEPVVVSRIEHLVQIRRGR